MENKTIVWAVVGVLALGGVWYLFANSTPQSVTESLSVATTTPPTSTSTPQVAPAPTTKPGTAKKPVVTAAKINGYDSLLYLLGLKQSLVCNITVTNSSGKRTGTAYVAGGRARVNFATTSMVNDGTYLYAWVNAASTGLKLLAASSVSWSAIAGSGGLDPSVSFSFACNPWSENANLFVPPTSVSFSSTR